MEAMTLHNLKSQVKMIDDKATKLLSVEALELYKKEYEK